MVISNCEYCNKKKEYIYKSAVKRFCSHKCSNTWKWENIREKAKTKILVCEQCNDEFIKDVSFLKQHPNTKFCSHKCSSIFSRTRYKTICPTCGLEFETTRNKYCSKECGSIGKRKSYLKWEDKLFVKNYNKEYIENNKEELNKKKLQYSQTPKGKAVKTASRLKRRSAGKLTGAEIIELKDSYNNKCYWCNSEIENNKLHLDHYIPISLGGKSNKENIVVSCSKCNQSKGASNPLDYANKIGKLL